MSKHQVCSCGQTEDPRTRELTEWIAAHRDEPGVALPALQKAQEIYGFLPVEAQRIVAGDVPFKLRDKEVYLLDLTALVAGTQFRGQFEQRMKGLIDEVKKLRNIILMIDEIHNIVGAGDAEGSMNAANIL